MTPPCLHVSRPCHLTGIPLLLIELAALPDAKDVVGRCRLTPIWVA